ncbi:murein L,D-transpeptidase catalytic domain family protein [Prosthecochloris sp. HL-130-GSB]|jgi:hypothetical protein|uniref:murein L,D-transpeptidase catalytic domain family protein n=1 Tax=Prosthecochloris sp. HL-130-GSB TaxID=1974213 RepID=UPI000A1C1839|nr:murein L,D-transpeptidase catalytic domain family protein [Prosthecochloris sp. HL-130-GSB]ARM31798.1 hypothetical protein B9H02_11460 [Prosthecochloris sp. HL-130-GSB]MBO8092387.1 murein L,D-transpeptidase catalytic domain family protein [Prosthecochloris sp.]
MKSSPRIAAICFFSLFSLMAGAFLLFIERPAVSDDALAAAFRAHDAYLKGQEDRADVRVMAVVDYTLPSYAKRMLIIDMATGEQTAYRVAHGTNSGELYATLFSNEPGSYRSSLGLFSTGDVYYGEHGLAIRLHGLDSLQNSNAFERDIVLHSAWYVSIPVIIENILTLNGPRIGRSNGCFVVSPDVIGEVVGKLEGNALLYAYGNRERL